MAAFPIILILEQQKGVKSALRRSKWPNSTTIFTTSQNLFRAFAIKALYVTCIYNIVLDQIKQA